MAWSPPHARPAAWHACTTMRLGIRIWPREGWRSPGDPRYAQGGAVAYFRLREDLGGGNLSIFFFRGASLIPEEAYSEQEFNSDLEDLK